MAGASVGGTGAAANTSQLVMTGIPAEIALKLKEAGALSPAAGSHAVGILNVAEKIKVWDATKASAGILS